MRIFHFPVVALAMVLAAPAAQAADSPPMAPVAAPMPSAASMAGQVGGRRNWGPLHKGRWTGGWRAPGGWAGYRRPYYGYALPSYWISPSFFIGNYASYGFPQPPAGYGWSRYYDDAVMTDSYGRVYTYYPGVAWDRYDQYEGKGYRGGKDNTIGGGVAGAAVGAIGGALIAGRGDRTEGALIGGALGAVAGAVLGSSADRRDDRDPRPPVAQGDGPHGDGRYGADYGEWDGKWQGEWKKDGADGDRVYEGVYTGTYREGDPHWGHHGARPPMGYPGGYGPGYGYGYGYPAYGYGEQWITVPGGEPIVKKSTSVRYVTEYVTVPTRKRVVYKRPVRRAKPRCQCGLIMK